LAEEAVGNPAFKNDAIALSWIEYHIPM